MTECSCYECGEPIVASDDDARVCIQCGGRNRRRVAPSLSAPSPFRFKKPATVDEAIQFVRGFPHEDDVVARCVADVLIERIAELENALGDIESNCNGYGDIAGWACRRAAKALRPESDAK